MRRLAALAVAGLLCACPGPRVQKPSPAPVRSARAGSGVNVILITIDTLRADHLGTYGYARATSPNLDALASRGLLFEQAYTHWPKTRGSFVMMMTGRRASQNGFSKEHQELLGFNATIASVLKDAGYATHASVDNANVAAELGYAKGFDTYRQTWQEQAALPTEVARTEAITSDGIRIVKGAKPGSPFFLWLHYVNPHTPYTPPAPHDQTFVDASVATSRRLPIVKGFTGGIPEQWKLGDHDRLGHYVAQYDGEIAYADAEVGRVLDALRASAVQERTVVIVTSDHGESLGEHDYYFDHGQDLFDPSLRVPLIVAGPGVKPGRTPMLASTLDVLPTILDLAKVSYPPDLAGRSLAGSPPARDRLFAQNDRGLSATFDARHKLIETPGVDDKQRWALYDRSADPGETRDLVTVERDAARVHRRELELWFEAGAREWGRTKSILQPGSGSKLSPEACANMVGMGYVEARCAP